MNPQKHNRPEEWTIVLDNSTKWWNIDFKALIGFRYLLFLFVRRDFVALYKQTILGPLWFIVQPLLMTIVFSVIFGNIAGLSPTGVPTFLFYLSGITAWNYFADCVNKTSATFTMNVHIFSKVYFPRLLVPVSIVISNIVKLIIQYAMFLVFLAIYIVTGTDLQPNLWILATPFLFIIMAGMGLGFGLIISSLTTKYRDLQNLVAFGVQLMMFMTPVVYPLSKLPPDLSALAVYNPMTPIIELFRYAYLGNGTFRPWQFGYCALFTLIMLTVGMAIFTRVEKNFMDTV